VSQLMTAGGREFQVPGTRRIVWV